MQHIEQLEQRVARLEQYLLEGLQPWQPQLGLLQTLPGIDEQGRPCCWWRLART